MRICGCDSEYWWGQGRCALGGKLKRLDECQSCLLHSGAGGGFP